MELNLGQCVCISCNLSLDRQPEPTSAREVRLSQRPSPKSHTAPRTCSTGRGEELRRERERWRNSGKGVKRVMHVRSVLALLHPWLDAPVALGSKGGRVNLRKHGWTPTNI